MTARNATTALLWIALIAVLLFVPAGTLDWPAAWAFLGEFVIGGAAITAWLAWRDPALLKERMGGAFQEGQSAADKLFMGVIVIVWYSWIVLMALDAKRWHLSHLPDTLRVLGGALIPLGFLIVWRVFRANSFAAPVVRIQNERGQHVIDTGPYALVRHPMYAGAILYMLGMPLLLGSWLGLAVLPLIVLALVVRIFIEESVLRKGIPGYDDYAARVRWRLLPGVW